MSVCAGLCMFVPVFQAIFALIDCQTGRPRDNICTSTCSTSALRLYFAFVLNWDVRGVG